MDLTLHLGGTLAGLKQSMTEHELRQWRQYVARRLLPMRRIELMLAQLTRILHIGVAGGPANAEVEDYLVDPGPVPNEDADDAGEISAEDIAAMTGATVFRKGAG